VCHHLRPSDYTDLCLDCICISVRHNGHLLDFRPASLMSTELKNQQWSYTAERFVYFCLLLTRLATDRDISYCVLFRWGTALQAGRSRVRFPTVSLEFFIDIILPSSRTLAHFGTQFHPDPAHKLSANLYDIYHCCVYSEKLLMVDRGTVRNM